MFGEGSDITETRVYCNKYDNNIHSVNNEEDLRVENGSRKSVEKFIKDITCHNSMIFGT